MTSDQLVGINGSLHVEVQESPKEEEEEFE